ncbi:MAG: TRAPP subunit trs31 [Bathelium mastoideum]|nr:MAG: TRAPP subunit trs31 [Bathelium mastoideum]
MSSQQPAKSPHNAPSYQPLPPPRSSTPSLRYPSNRKTIYDRNLNRSRTSELSRASFAYLFVEMISYAQQRVKGIADLEKRLNTQGYPLGLKLLDLLLYREPARSSLRPTRILALLQFIHNTLWRHLFGRPADALERSTAAEAEYMISDNEPLVNAYISVPREMSQLNCAAYVAGVIEGVCDGAGFPTWGVTAHWANEGGEGGGGAEGGGGGGGAGGSGGMWPGKTIFLIKFRPEVLEREEILAKGS